MRKNTPEQNEAKRIERNARMREWHRMQKEHHICKACGKQDAYTLNGRTYCAECAAKLAAYKRKWRAEHPGINAERMAVRRRKWKDEGRCNYCGKVLQDKSHKSCTECRAKMHKWNMKRSADVNHPRGGNGICYQCNKRSVKDGFRLCEQCYGMKVAILHDVNANRDNSNHVWRRMNNAGQR